MKIQPLMILVFGVLSFGGEMAFAQTFAPPPAPRAPRPTLSPYLNLLNRNNSTAFNYYNFVRPRQAFDAYRAETNSDLRTLDRRLERANEALRQSENSQLAPSGHRTRFMDLGGYFGTGTSQAPIGGGNFGRR